MGYKVKRIYQGTNLVRPSEITETYTNFTYNTNITIAKSGYKISKIILRGAIQNPSINGTYNFKAYSNTGYDYGAALSAGSTWSESTYGYGFVYYDSPNFTKILTFPSNATTSSNGAYELTLLSTSASIKVGKTYGNWIYNNTWSYTQQQATNIQNIFSSSSSYIKNYINMLSFRECEVTYKPN